MTLVSGTRLGPYEIVSPLGAGGMGEVYRARDTRLQRDVAVKVLPSSFSTDPDRLRRFEQEARAAGQLNHPNITSVYDVGTADTSPYVVTELLEGESLRSRLAGGALPPRRAIDYAIQIAQGLAAAHEKGIVHRDLKPENLFVTKEGRVKILDFGLAKLTHSERADGRTNAPTESVGTEPGIVMGTLGYMSPEQVRGKAADPRSDIFSFGAILYEMLSGRRAFQGDSAADTMSAILMKEPEELSATNRNVSPGLERLVRHCLEKNPEERFHSAHDLAFDLEALSGVSGVAAAPALPARPRSSPALLAGILAAVALSAVAAYLLRRPRPVEPPRTSFLTFSGSDSEPAVSPDGRLVAFVSAREGRSRIWLKQIATGDEVALTAGDDAHPRFSRDGSGLLFTHAEGDRSSLYRMSVVGGEPRKMIDDALAGDWSPDASRVVFIRPRDRGREAGSALAVAASDGSSERILATSQVPIASPRWSPDGETIAYVTMGRGSGRPDELVLIDVASGTSRSLPPRAGGGSISSVAWTFDGKGILYAQSGELTGLVPLARLLLQNVDSGATRLLLWMPYFVTGVDGGPGFVVLDAVALSENLVELPFSSGSTAHEQVTRGNSIDRQPAYSPDGRQIVFSSTRSGNIEVWGVDRRDGAVRRLTQDPAQDWDPGFTRDGRTLLYSSNRGGHFEIWTAEPDGRRARQLTRDGVDAENPVATPDGEWIVYSSLNPEKGGIWKIRRDGSRQVRLTTDVPYHPEVSPDGQYVLYHTPPDPGGTELRVVRFADGRPVDYRIRLSFKGAQLPVALRGSTGSLGRARWTPDGRAIAFIAVDEKNRSGVMLQDFAPGRDTTATRRPLAGFDDKLNPESLGISPDGARLVVSSVQTSSALMLVDGLPGVPGRTSPK